MNVRNEQLNPGDRVEIYRNLHRNCFSVRRNGIVVKHLFDDESIALENVSFVVREKGRLRVLKEKKKNVHAFVRGTVSSSSHFTGLYFQAYYNPYIFESFMKCKGKGEEMFFADKASIYDGKIWVE